MTSYRSIYRAFNCTDNILRNGAKSQDIDTAPPALPGTKDT